MVALQPVGGQIVPTDTEVLGDRGRMTFIPVADPGTPLASYTGGSLDPLQVWKSQPSVRKVVGFIARNVASLHWKAFARVSDTDRQRHRDSPAEERLRAPGGMISGYKLIRDIVTDLCLYDRFLIVLVDGSLRRIPPRMVDIVSDAFGGVARIRVITPDGAIDITEHPKAFSTGWAAQYAGGVSPMVTLSDLITEQTRAVRWRSKQWENAPKLSGVLQMEGEFKDDTKRTRFVQTWRRWRDEEAGGTPILENGLEYKPLDRVKPAETEDLEGRRLTDAEVASAFFVPPELVGARQGTFSNLEAFRGMLFGPVLGPMIEELQQALNLELVRALDSHPGLYLEADRETAMNGSFLEQAKTITTSTGGPWVTRNEARAMKNLPRIDGADELITPKNVSEGGQASPYDSGSQNDGVPNDLRGEQ